MKILTAALFFFVAFSACDNHLADMENENQSGTELTSAGKQLAETGNSFGFNLFRETSAWDDSENVFISPLSVSMALSMTLNGAGGETFDEMRRVLRLENQELSTINEGYGSLRNFLMEQDPKVRLEIANSIWYRNGLQVKNEFSERVREVFEAQIEGLDFRDPAAAARINEWVEDQTEGLIPEIIQEIPEEMVMYLINAIYFKGDWLLQFDPEETRKAPFFLETGESVEVDMMKQKDQFAAFFSEDIKMIELPYGDSLYSMTVLMPANPDVSIDDFVAEQVNEENLVQWRSQLTESEVPLELPKFELEYEISYNDILEAMGMELAFNREEADLSGIADVEPENLYISEVKHKTFIRVDEEGTEAAAATSVGIGVTSLPPSMIVNRPFVFIIHERESGANLFFGKVKRPVRF